MAHITGGGMTDNIPRVLPHGTAAVVDRATWEVPPLFGWLARSGRVPVADMMRTFNMGMGLVIVVERECSEQVIEQLAARGGRDSRVIGRVVAGERPAVSYVNVE
jgi:phosphoribosylformylglycinamidine cyclo-ligase